REVDAEPVAAEPVEQGQAPRTADEAPAATEPAPPSVRSEPAPAASAPAVPWETLIAALWLTTSGLWFVLAAWRTCRFRRLLCHATPAPEGLQKHARRLASQLGLSHCPGVWLLPGRVSPILWTVGRPRLLLPAGLWERLKEEQRATLLAHE